MHTRSGVALIANDMHLDLGVPAVWYPARLRVTGDPAIDITGVTLARHAGGGRGFQRPGRLGIHQQLRRFRRRALGQVREPRLSACAARRIAVKGADVRRGRISRRRRRRRARRRGLRRRRGQRRMPAGRVARDATRGHQLRAARTSSGRAASTTCWRWRRASEFPGRTWWSAIPRGRIAWTLLGRVPRTAGPTGCSARSSSAMPPIIRASPIRRWAGCGPRTSAWSTGALEAVLGDDEVDVGAGGYDIGARARQIRDDLLSLAHPATEADMLAIQLDSRALFLARWRDLLLALLDEDAMVDAPQRREFRALVSEWKRRSQRRRGRLPPGAHVSRQHAECAVAQPQHRVVGREVRRAAARRSSRPPAGGWSASARRRSRRRAAVTGARSCCSGSMPPSRSC